jgi:hypothetical protein
MASGQSAGERAGRRLLIIGLPMSRNYDAKTIGPIFLSATTAPLRMRLCRREYPACPKMILDPRST